MADSKTVLQAIEAIPANNIQRVSCELDISQFSVVHQHHDIGKSIRTNGIVTKILQKFWLIPVDKC